MNKRFVGVLTFAFVVAAGASLILYKVLLRQPQAAKAASTTRVVVATKNLDLGVILKENDVQLVEWSGAVPQGASATTKDVVGRGVTTAMLAKEPVMDSRLAPLGAGGGLAAMIPPGMRAVAVRVNEVVGVAGFVIAGTRVDVLISGTAPGANGSQGMLTRTLLQNVEVLSAGQDFKKDNEGKPIVVQVINLLVTPEHAEQLSLAASQTQIQLVLRNPLDRVESKTPGTALAQLFTGQKRPLAEVVEPSTPRRQVQRAAPQAVQPPPPKKEAPFVMEIISGTKKVETKFENKDGGEGK